MPAGHRKPYSLRYTYDYTTQRLQKVKQGVASEEYTYDDLDRITSKITFHNSAEVLAERITYDAESNLVSELELGNWGTYRYTYDGNGNITSVTKGNKTTSYVYDSQNQLIRENNQEAGKTWVWAYDAAGNIIDKDAYAYSTGDGVVCWHGKVLAVGFCFCLENSV